MEEGTVKPWDCTFEADCDCPECESIRNDEQEAEYFRILEAIGDR